MSVTTHERPGVYSEYDASSVVQGRQGRKMVGMAAIHATAPAGVPQTVTSYEGALIAFGSTGGQDMTELIRLALKNGAAGVVAVPVADGAGGVAAVLIAQVPAQGIDFSQVVSQVLETCASLPEVKPVLTSDRGTYANTKGEPWFHDCILAYFDNYQQVDDLSSVHEDFYKISLCDRAGAVKNSFRLMPQSLRDSAAAASAARRERIAVAAGGAGETVTELLERAKALNSERVVLVAPGGTDEEGKAVSGLSLAAAVAGAIAGTTDPALPLGGAVLSGLYGLETTYGDNDLDLLIRGGVTPAERTGGVTSVVRGVTTRTTTDGTADTTWRELSTILVVDDVIPGIRSALRSKFHRAKNTEQSRGAIRSQVVLELENRKEREIISGYDNVAVSADPDNPTVCQVEFSFSAAQGLNQIWLTAHITV